MKSDPALLSFNGRSTRDQFKGETDPNSSENHVEHCRTGDSSHSGMVSTAGLHFAGQNRRLRLARAGRSVS